LESLSGYRPLALRQIKINETGFYQGCRSALILNSLYPNFKYFYIILAVFQIRVSLNADPDPGFYLNADPDSGFLIPDPDPRSFLPKNFNQMNFFSNFKFLYHLFHFLIHNIKELIQNLNLFNSCKIVSRNIAKKYLIFLNFLVIL